MHKTLKNTPKSGDGQTEKPMYNRTPHAGTKKGYDA